MRGKDGGGGAGRRRWVDEGQGWVDEGQRMGGLELRVQRHTTR